MTLQERMERCLDMARTAPTPREQDLYLKELSGLQGMEATGLYTDESRNAYELGRRDRATLLRLDDTDHDG